MICSRCGLRVTAGGKRVFIAQGQVEGKAVCVTVGPYGEWTEHKAREKARNVLQGLREGIDPHDAKES
ncbi:Arm DNA-binding domain-containing protein [Burkholderia ubonensis]